MASRKPAIGGGGISDDLAKKLIKGLSGAVGKAKKAQSTRIINKIEKKNPVIRSKGWNDVVSVKSKAGRLQHQLTISDTMKKKRPPKPPSGGAGVPRKPKPKGPKPTPAQQRSINEGYAQRQLEINANKKKLNRKADRILNTIDLAEKRGAGMTTKNKRGKTVVYPEKAQGAQRSRAGAVGGGYKQANIRAKAKSDEFKAAIRAERDPKKRAALRAKARKHRDKTGF